MTDLSPWLERCLAPEEVLWVVTGCPFGVGGFERRHMSSNVVKVPLLGWQSPLELWLQKDRSTSQWAVREMTGAIPDEPLRWRATFGERVGGIVREVRLVSEEWNGTVGRTFDLQFSLTQVRLDPMFDPSAFADPPQGPGSIVAVDDLWRTQPPQILSLLVEDRAKQ